MLVKYRTKRARQVGKIIFHRDMCVCLCVRARYISLLLVLIAIRLSITDNEVRSFRFELSLLSSLISSVAFLPLVRRWACMPKHSLTMDKKQTLLLLTTNTIEAPPSGASILYMLVDDDADLL